MGSDDTSLESFFIDEDYVLHNVAVGPYEIPFFCLRCSSTDYDLTGQILWPGTELLNSFIIKNAGLFSGSSILELGSGVGLSGLLCGRICDNVVMTDHNDVVLKNLRKNVELQPSSIGSISCEKLEWGNEEQLANMLERNSRGFDFVLGADICYQQCNLDPLIKTLTRLLCNGKCRAFLAYVSRLHSTDLAFFNKVSEQGCVLNEVPDTRMSPGSGTYQGVVYEITLL